MKSYIAAIDIGTTKVCTLIAEKHSNFLEVIGLGCSQSFGLKKGSIVDIENTIDSITQSIEEAKKMSEIRLVEEAIISIAGNHISSFNTTGVVAIREKEISQEDVDRVLDSAKSIILPVDREILHILPKEYKVDHLGGIKNPIGMTGVRLEVYVHIVTASSSLIKNLEKCVIKSGVKPEKIVLQPLASSKAVLSEEEKENGVLLVDIGGGTTDLALWKDGSLWLSLSIPIGGNHFTHDITTALRISSLEAEKIKIRDGSLLDQEKMIKTQNLVGEKEKEISSKILKDILLARSYELANVIFKILKEKDYLKFLGAGIVLTGGGATLKGLVELFEAFFQKPAKLGFPRRFCKMDSSLIDPKFSTALGLLLEENSKNHKIYKEIWFFNKFKTKIKEIFLDIF